MPPVETSASTYIRPPQLSQPQDPNLKRPFRISRTFKLSRLIFRTSVSSSLAETAPLLFISSLSRLVPSQSVRTMKSESFVELTRDLKVVSLKFTVRSGLSTSNVSVVTRAQVLPSHTQFTQATSLSPSLRWTRTGEFGDWRMILRRGEVVREREWRGFWRT